LSTPIQLGGEVCPAFHGVHHPQTGGSLVVQVELDEDNRITIGSVPECAVRIEAPGVLPVHAYITSGSNRRYCYLAPGGRLMANEQEVVNPAPATDEDDFRSFRMVSGPHIEIAGVYVDVPHSVG
jgi:hypothetical protein